MPTIPPSDQRGTLIALEPRIRAAFHPLYHEIARRRDLPPTAKIIYAVLCSYHHMFSDVFPGRDRLATDSGLSAHQLVDGTQALVKAGLLDVRRRGFGQTNVYTLLRWAPPADVPQGITVVPDGISGDSQGNLLPIEEKDLKEAPDSVTSEENPWALWTAALATLRDQYHVSAGNLGVLGGLPVRLDRGVLVVQAPADIARKWAGMVGQATGRPVRFES